MTNREFENYFEMMIHELTHTLGMQDELFDEFINPVNFF